MKHVTEHPETGLNRREFARLALMTSALLMGSDQLVEAAKAEPDSEFVTVAYFGALRTVPPGAVQPEGWLRAYLKTQALQLGSKLPEISFPFAKPYWAEEKEGWEQAGEESWAPWEQTAYWIDGATRLALVLRDEKLLAQVKKPVEYTLSHAVNGYLGPAFFKDPKGDFHRWPHTVFFRSCEALADARATVNGFTAMQIAEAMQRHFLSDDASYAAPIRNVTNIESILWCFQRTGNPQLLTLAENAWREYIQTATDPWHGGHGDLLPVRVFSDTPINEHGVTYAETAKLPAILYMYTGKDEYLALALAAQRRIFNHHMLVDGIPSTTEYFRTVTSLDSHETCDIADHTWSWGYLLLATGDGAWADHIERACFNAGPGAIKNDWKALQYFSCPNQFLATFDSNHNWLETGGYRMAYQPNPGRLVACCAGNVHRIFPNYLIRMWMKTNDGGLAAVLYGPSRITTTVGSDNQQIEIVQTTGYPFDEEIHFTINTHRPVSFSLSFRIPQWCHAPGISVNGAVAGVSSNSRGFVVLHRTFEPGDVVTLTLPMKVAVTQWPQAGIAIEHGPLVYSFPIREDWTTKVVQGYSTREFPCWEATPATHWNYGVVLHLDNPESEVEVKRRSVPPDRLIDPWGDPPISITVPARRIEDWKLQVNPHNPNQKFTPCLPDINASRMSEAIERVSLVPYGATQLRVTIFPRIASIGRI